METFPALVHQHFGWLVSEYNFAVSREDKVVVEYASPVCRVEVWREHYLVVVLIGSLEPVVIRRVRTGVGDVVEAKDAGAAERWSARLQEYLQRPDSIDLQLAGRATLLRQYCDEMLRGDFSLRDELKRLREERMRAHRRPGDTP